MSIFISFQQQQLYRQNVQKSSVATACVLRHFEKAQVFFLQLTINSRDFLFVCLILKIFFYVVNHIYIAKQAKKKLL